MTRKSIIVFMLGLLCTPGAFGDQYPLEFSGQHTISCQDQVVKYSGQMMFDSDVNTRGGSNGDFSDYLTAFEVVIGGVMFDQVLTPVIASVINDDSLFGD